MSSLLAAIHYFALAIGFAGILLRGIFMNEAVTRFDEIKTSKEKQNLIIKKIYLGDNLWGVAALLWIITGLTRAFGPFEKGSDYYLHNPWFHIKMTIFLIVFLLEIKPMILFIKWRLAKKQTFVEQDISYLKTALRLNQAETILVLITPFIASMMARFI